MSDRISQHADGRQHRLRLRAATVAASTAALGMTLVLPVMAVAHASKRPGRSAHRTALHAPRLSSHGHHTSLSYPADLTVVFSWNTGSFLEAVSAVPAGRPHERTTPTASARGPPAHAEDS